MATETRGILVNKAGMSNGILANKKYDTVDRARAQAERQALIEAYGKQARSQRVRINPSSLPALQIPDTLTNMTTRSAYGTRGANTPVDAISLAGSVAGSENMRKERVQFWSRWRKRLA